MSTRLVYKDKFTVKIHDLYKKADVPSSHIE